MVVTINGADLSGLIVRQGADYAPRTSINQASWDSVLRTLDKYSGRASLGLLAAHIGKHKSAGGTPGFLLYCLRHGWLEVV